jgi:hypothetical protein
LGGDDLAMHHCTGRDRRGSWNIHAVVGLDVSALALDAVPPSEQSLVMMVGRGLGRRLPTGRRVARLIITKWGRGRNRGNGQQQAV